MTKLELTEYQKGLLKHIVKESYRKDGEKTTVALITLQNGFEIVGTSGCVNPADFDFEIGKHYALVDALTKLGGYVGFYMQEIKYQSEVAIQAVRDLAKESGLESEEVEVYIQQLQEEVDKALGQYK